MYVEGSTMDIRFEEQGNGNYSIVADDDRQLGVVVPQTNGSYGYSLFGTPHMGSEGSLDDVERTIQRHLD
jgi:hypothetical protein